MADLTEQPSQTSAHVRRHLRIGWWSLLVFLSLGIALEIMHGFKLAWLLDVSNETRRLMWRLAHAHGVLLALLHMGFAATLGLGRGPRPERLRLVSRLLTAAGLLIPAGFFLGGVIVYESDPWVGILLLPIGATLLFLGVLLTAIDTGRAG